MSKIERAKITQMINGLNDIWQLVGSDKTLVEPYRFEVEIGLSNVGYYLTEKLAELAKVEK